MSIVLVLALDICVSAVYFSIVFLLQIPVQEKKSAGE